ncbi:MAG: hypothetical protein Q8910_00350 [Bacteroidota bacterium]|nr:hypothetical protein [Bacteroidota bacterium]
MELTFKIVGYFVLIIGFILLAVIYSLYVLGKLIVCWLWLLWQMIAAVYIVPKTFIQAMWPIVKDTFKNFNANLEQK